MDTFMDDALNTRELLLNDIMRGRTELLLLMAKDFLEGKTLGRIQRQAIEENALLVEQDCMTSITAVGKEPVDDHTCVNIRFFYYLKSLAEMMKSAVLSSGLDKTCEDLIHDHVDIIAEMLYQDDRIDDHFIEKCLSLQLLKVVAAI